MLSTPVHGIGQGADGVRHLKNNDYRSMALDDVTHDRALPRNLFYNQIGGGEGNRTPVTYLFQPTVYMLFTFNIRVTIMCKCVTQISHLTQ